GDIAVVKGIERREIALAGHAKHVPHSMHDELIDQNFGGGPRAVIGAHHASPWLCSSRLHHAASMWGGQTSASHASGRRLALEHVRQLRHDEPRSGGEGKQHSMTNASTAPT